jgi:hypothetical protein
MTEVWEQYAAADVNDVARAAMWEMITGYRISQIIRVAVALSLPEYLAEGPTGAEKIARPSGW